MQIIFFKLELVIWWGREKNTFLFWKLFIKHHLIFFNTRIHLLICFWRYEHIVPHGRTPTAEQQNQFLAHCKRVHLDPSLLGGDSVKQIHGAHTFQKNSYHLHKGKLPPVILFCARVQWLGIEYQHKLSQGLLCPRGWQQLFTHSSCAAKGHSMTGELKKFPCSCVPRAWSFFLICRCTNFPKIRIKMESISSWKLLLASWLLKTLLRWVHSRLVNYLVVFTTLFRTSFYCSWQWTFFLFQHWTV